MELLLISLVVALAVASLYVANVVSRAWSDAYKARMELQWVMYDALLSGFAKRIREGQ